jgi:hypothetical protein
MRDTRTASEFIFLIIFFHPTCVRFLAKCDNSVVDSRYVGLDLIS